MVTVDQCWITIKVNAFYTGILVMVQARDGEEGGYLFHQYPFKALGYAVDVGDEIDAASPHSHFEASEV